MVDIVYLFERQYMQYTYSHCIKQVIKLNSLWLNVRINTDIFITITDKNFCRI